MKYRRLGRTGLHVSEISLGTWITTGGQLQEDRSIRVIRKAWDVGITTFDTADIYARGAAEEILGRAVRDLPREQLVICTKGHGRMWDGPNGRGSSRKHLMTAIEHSLRRLGMDHVDLYQVHAWDSQTPLAETLIALDDIVRQGKALHVGCSNWSGAQITEAVRLAGELGLRSRIDSNQPYWNMLGRGFEGDGLEVCRTHGVGILIYCPLCQGVLTGKYDRGVPKTSRAAGRPHMRKNYVTPENIATVRALARVARDKKCTVAQLALAWLLADDATSSPIVGATRPEQVVENAGAPDVKLTPGDLERIEAILSGTGRRKAKK